MTAVNQSINQSFSHSSFLPACIVFLRLDPWKQTIRSTQKSSLEHTITSLGHRISQRSPPHPLFPIFATPALQTGVVWALNPTFRTNRAGEMQKLTFNIGGPIGIIPEHGVLQPRFAKSCKMLFFTFSPFWPLFGTILTSFSTFWPPISQQF